MEENFFLKRRKELDLTQLEIATQLGKTTSAVSAWERNENPPHIKLVPQLAIAYRVSESRILQAINEMHKVAAT